MLKEREHLAKLCWLGGLSVKTNQLLSPRLPANAIMLQYVISNLCQLDLQHFYCHHHHQHFSRSRRIIKPFWLFLLTEPDLHAQQSKNCWCFEVRNKEGLQMVSVKLRWGTWWGFWPSGEGGILADDSFGPSFWKEDFSSWHGLNWTVKLFSCFGKFCVMGVFLEAREYIR